jgi:hypothetical protein
LVQLSHQSLFLGDSSPSGGGSFEAQDAEKGDIDYEKTGGDGIGGGSTLEESTVVVNAKKPVRRAKQSKTVSCFQQSFLFFQI